MTSIVICFFPTFMQQKRPLFVFAQIPLIPARGPGEESRAAADQVGLQHFDQPIQFNSFYTNFRTL